MVVWFQLFQGCKERMFGKRCFHRNLVVVSQAGALLVSNPGLPPPPEVGWVGLRVPSASKAPTKISDLKFAPGILERWGVVRPPSGIPPTSTPGFVFSPEMWATPHGTPRNWSQKPLTTSNLTDRRFYDRLDTIQNPDDVPRKPQNA